MINTTRTYNIHMVNGRVLSTRNCPILVDNSLQPLAYFIVPVAIEKHENTLMENKKYFNLRINHQNVLFVDEIVDSNQTESANLDALFSVQTISAHFSPNE